MRHHFRIELRKNPCPTGGTATQPVLHSAICGGVSTLYYTFSHNLAANAISGTSKNSVLKNSLTIRNPARLVARGLYYGRSLAQT